MLALAVLATVAAGAVEVEPRPGWREPLCLFTAVGMDAGARKSAVFTALTRPIAEFERNQAAAALPAAEAAALVVPPIPRWLVDDATPEALAGLLATYGRIALLSPEGDVFDQMAGRYNQAGPNLGVYLKGHAAAAHRSMSSGRA
jgi:hypothetical protein